MFKRLKTESGPREEHGLRHPTSDHRASSTNSLNNLIEQWFRHDMTVPEDLERWNVGWGCDVNDSENEIVVRAEAPGFEPDEIDIKLSGNQLVLQAEHRGSGEDGSSHYGQFYRSMTLPRGVQSEGITAKYTNGVVEVHVPKGEETRVRRIPVNTA